MSSSSGTSSSGSPLKFSSILSSSLSISSSNATLFSVSRIVSSMYVIPFLISRGFLTDGELFLAVIGDPLV